MSDSICSVPQTDQNTKESCLFLFFHIVGCILNTSMSTLKSFQCSLERWKHFKLILQHWNQHYLLCIIRSSMTMTYCLLIYVDRHTISGYNWFQDHITCIIHYIISLLLFVPRFILRITYGFDSFTNCPDESQKKHASSVGLFLFKLTTFCDILSLNYPPNS